MTKRSHLEQVITADVAAFSRQRPSDGPLDVERRSDVVRRAGYLAAQSDAFGAVLAMRLGRWASERRIPVMGWLGRRLAVSLAQVAIDPEARVAPGVYFPHGQVVVSGNSVVKHGVSMAPYSRVEPAEPGEPGPEIGALVQIGTGAVVRGNVRVARGAAIGANALVERDVAEGAVIVGVHSDAVPTREQLGASSGELRTELAELVTGPDHLSEPDTTRRVVDLRHRAALAHREPQVPWPAHEPVEVDVVDGMATCTPDQLSVDLVRSAIETHGHLLVKGLLSASQIEAQIASIDETLAAARAWKPGKAGSDVTRGSDVDRPIRFAPFVPSARFGLAGVPAQRMRKRLSGRGAVWMADAPAGLASYVELLEQVGLARLLGEYLGGPPEISVKKSIFRRVPAPSPMPGGWHQDGAFMGTGMRTLNVWMALTSCSNGVPGMDIVPTRIGHVVPTGTPGAEFDWSVAPDRVEAVCGNGVEVVRPAFEAGDAVLFDEVMLHRTAGGPEMDQPRYAIESWFFAPGACPEDQIPFAL